MAVGEASQRLADVVSTARRRREGRPACMESREALRASGRRAADGDGEGDGE